MMFCPTVKVSETKRARVHVRHQSLSSRKDAEIITTVTINVARTKCRTTTDNCHTTTAMCVRQWRVFSSSEWNGYVRVIVSSQYNTTCRFGFIDSSFSTSRNKSRVDNIRFLTHSDEKKRTPRTNQLLSFRVRFITMYTLFGTPADSRFTVPAHLYNKRMPFVAFVNVLNVRLLRSIIFFVRRCPRNVFPRLSTRVPAENKRCRDYYIRRLVHNLSKQTRTHTLRFETFYRRHNI